MNTIVSVLEMLGTIPRRPKLRLRGRRNGKKEGEQIVERDARAHLIARTPPISAVSRNCRAEAISNLEPIGQFDRDPSSHSTFRDYEEAEDGNRRRVREQSELFAY